MTLSDTCKKLSVSMFSLAILSVILGFIFLSSPWVFAKGVAFGTLFSICRIVLMERTINRSLNMGRSASSYATLHYTLRYLLSAIVLVVAALEPSISLYGTILGFVFLRLAVYIVHFIDRRNHKDTP